MTTTTRLIILYPSYFFPSILHFIYKNIQRCIASAVTTTIERSYGRIYRIMKRLMYTCITRRKRKDTLALNEYLIRQQNNEFVLSFSFLFLLLSSVVTIDYFVSFRFVLFRHYFSSSYVYFLLSLLIAFLSFCCRSVFSLV